MATIQENLKTKSDLLDQILRIRQSTAPEQAWKELRELVEITHQQSDVDVSEKPTSKTPKFLTKRPFKKKMARLDTAWADKIWNAASEKNLPCKMAIAALALTGVRPATLENGIDFSIVVEGGIEYLRARFDGAKQVIKEGKRIRGQEWIEIDWRLDEPEPSHRMPEFEAMVEAAKVTPGQAVRITFDAESISNRLRELSKKLWPRRQIHISGICYRELLSSVAKSADVDRTELAAALGHLSEVSSGSYQRRAKGGTMKRPFTQARAAQAPRTMTQKKTERKEDHLAKFKRTSAAKKRASAGN